MSRFHPIEVSIESGLPLRSDAIYATFLPYRRVQKAVLAAIGPNICAFALEILDNSKALPAFSSLMLDILARSRWRTHF